MFNGLFFLSLFVVVALLLMRSNDALRPLYEVAVPVVCIIAIVGGIVSILF